VSIGVILSLGPFSRPVFDLNTAQNGVRTLPAAESESQMEDSVIVIAANNNIMNLVFFHNIHATNKH
jgi:hypothetical protein